MIKTLNVSGLPHDWSPAELYEVAGNTRQAELQRGIDEWKRTRGYFERDDHVGCLPEESATLDDDIIKAIDSEESVLPKAVRRRILAALGIEP